DFPRLRQRIRLVPVGPRSPCGTGGCMSVSKTAVFGADQGRVITRAPFPNSRMAYVVGSQPSIRVPMPEILQSPTLSGGKTVSTNPPVTVYDTSGPYADPHVDIDVHRGLAPLRLPWILGRNDVEELDDVTSEYGRRRASDPALEPIRFVRTRKPLR